MCVNSFLSTWTMAFEIFHSLWKQYFDVFLSLLSLSPAQVKASTNTSYICQFHSLTYLSLSHAISLTFETNWKVEIDKFICIGFAQKKLDVKNWKKIFCFCHESEWTVKVLDVVRKNSHSTRTTHNNSNNHNIHVTALNVSYCIAHINNNNDNNINEKKFPSWWQRGK